MWTSVLCLCIQPEVFSCFVLPLVYVCVCHHCRALQYVVERCGSAFEQHLTSDLLHHVWVTPTGLLERLATESSPPSSPSPGGYWTSVYTIMTKFITLHNSMVCIYQGCLLPVCQPFGLTLPETWPKVSLIIGVRYSAFCIQIVLRIAVLLSVMYYIVGEDVIISGNTSVPDSAAISWGKRTLLSIPPTSPLPQHVTPIFVHNVHVNLLREKFSNLLLYHCGCVVTRHYVAEGVRLHCQETWKLVTEMKGVQLVEKYIAQVHKHHHSVVVLATEVVWTSFPIHVERWWSSISHRQRQPTMLWERQHVPVLLSWAQRYVYIRVPCLQCIL